MPTIRVKAELSAQELLTAVKKLAPNEMDQFMTKVKALDAHRQMSRLSPKEKELLAKINQGLPKAFQKRYYALVEKRREGTISKKDYRELLRLTDDVERLQVERVKWMVELSRLRKISLSQLMEELPIKTPSHE
jgi:hypothetical protein